MISLSLSLSLSLKYNSNLYNGINVTSLRASLAAHTEKNKMRKNKNKLDKDVHHKGLNECMVEFNEDLDIAKRVS
jgi:hypothetical protein